jgi:hypothetical protein
LEGKVNVRRIQLLTIFSALILAAMVSADISGVLAQQNTSKITVLNPAIESKKADRLPLAPRLDKLDGKTIYLVDISWGGPEAAYSVFEEIKDWFAKNNPSVNIVIKRKAGSYTQDDPGLWKEIAAKGNAALIGISG